MDSSEIAAISKIIQELDARVPQDGAVVSIPSYSGGVDESYMVANQRGYLRFGIEMLKAAFAQPSKKRGDALDVDVNYLWDADSEVRIDWFERVGEHRKGRREKTNRTR